MPFSARRLIAGADRSFLDSTGRATRPGVRPIVWLTMIFAVAAGFGAMFVDPGRTSGPTLMTLGAFLVLAVALTVHWHVTQRLIDALGVATGEIEARNGTLVRVEAELLQTQKMASIGLLASGLAHDFNNTLAVVGGVAALIGEETTNLRTRADAGTIIGVVERARQLTRHLLAVARETDSASLPTNVPAVIVGLVPVLRQLVGPEIEIVIDVPERPMVVHTEAWQLEQALINLAVNARDAMPDGGRLAIGVSARRDDALVEIAVRDTGCGIPAERMDRIFEPFFTTKRVGHGSGLGLAMVRRFAAGAGGDVTVESAPSLGTTVAIRLPTAHEPSGLRSDVPTDRDYRPSSHASHATIPGWSHLATGVRVSGDMDRNPSREEQIVEVA